MPKEAPLRIKTREMEKQNRRRFYMDSYQSIIQNLLRYTQLQIKLDEFDKVQDSEWKNTIGK